MPGRNGAPDMKTRIGKPQRTSPIFREEVRVIRRHEYQDLVAPGSTADES
jgi:hypothetical protein